MSPPYHPPIYEVPRCPSDHLKVVLDYFEKLKKWDFDELSKLSTPNFTQQTLPASLGVATRTKSEDIAFLHDFRDALKGAPLEIVLYEVLEEKGRIWVHLFMKTVNTEAFFNFTFGTGKDKHLVVNLTEFVDSKVFAGGSSGDSSTEEQETETETAVQETST